MYLFNRFTYLLSKFILSFAHKIDFLGLFKMLDVFNLKNTLFFFWLFIKESRFWWTNFDLGSSIWFGREQVPERRVEIKHLRQVYRWVGQAGSLGYNKQRLQWQCTLADSDPSTLRYLPQQQNDEELPRAVNEHLLAAFRGHQRPVHSPRAPSVLAIRKFQQKQTSTVLYHQRYQPYERSINIVLEMCPLI